MVVIQKGQNVVSGTECPNQGVCKKKKSCTWGCFISIRSHGPPTSTLLPDQWSIYRLVFFSSVQLPAFHFDKYRGTEKKKTSLDWLQLFLVLSHVGPYSHTYFLHFWTLNHQKWPRIGWDMAKNIFVQVLCCKFTWAIIIVGTAICHHKNNNNMHNHVYHVILFI